jgi:hypothetical protein
MPDEPRLSLREPVDILTAIPFLVGYHPRDSMVVLALRGNQLILTVRHDLPEAGTPPRVIRQNVDYLAQVVLRQQVTAVFLVGFGAQERVSPMAFGLEAAYARAGLMVLEVLRADGNRYWSYLCDDTMCCPPEGSRYDGSSSALAAAWTVAGRVVLPDRKSYEEQITPVGGLARVAMGQATERAHRRMIELLSQVDDEDAADVAIRAAGTEMVEAALRYRRAGTPLEDDDVAWLTVLLGSDNMRNLVWEQIAGAQNTLGLHRTLWMDVMRRAAPDLVPAPACLFALAAWRCGEGALARLALERALRQDPGYDVASLLLSALAHGLSPNGFRNVTRPPVKRRSSRRQRRRSSSRREGTRQG